MNTDEALRQRWWGRGLLVLALFALAFQARTLYVFPIPDSLNYWYGDESWLMSEERTQIETGVIHHPYALGATINKQVGPFLGNTWLSSALYGLPAMVFRNSYPMILIGRTVTFTLAIATVLLLYFGLVKFGTNAVWAGLAALILSTCSAFTLASHSARLDLLIALAVFLVALYLARRITHARMFKSSLEAFAFGIVMTIISFIILPHLITLLLPVSAYAVVRLSGDTKLKPLANAALGAGVGLAIICGSYYLLTGDLSFYGTHSQHTQFAEVSAQKPVAHLFSRSVQWNNLKQRGTMLFGSAMFISLLGIAVVGKTVFDLVRKKAFYLREPRIREMMIVTVLVTLSWLLFQGSVSYYLTHVLVLITASFAMLASKAFGLNRITIANGTAIAVLTVLLLNFHIAWIGSTAEGAKLFSAENQRAIAKLHDRLRIDATGRSLHDALLLAELPCAFGLETDPALRLMYTSFISFPERDEDAGVTIKRFGVNYALLYVTAHDSSSIASIPSITKYLTSHGTLIDTATGVMFDMGRSYSYPDLSSRDTMKLYRLDEK